jgi:cell division protein ZapA (FtsZ GTPase activity inhibitor)
MNNLIMDNDNTLSVSVTICGRKFNLKIKTTEEEVIRKAAEEINKDVKVYAQKYAYKDMQDLLSMVSLQFATKLLAKEQESDFIQNKLQIRLEDLDSKISECLK